MAREGFLLPGKELEGAPKELNTWIPDKVPLKFTNRTVECSSPIMFRRDGTFYGEQISAKFTNDVRPAIPINQNVFEALCEPTSYDTSVMDKWDSLDFKAIGAKHGVALGEYWFAGFDGEDALLVPKKELGKIPYDTETMRETVAKLAEPELAKFEEIGRKLTSKRHALGGLESQVKTTPEDSIATVENIFKSDMPYGDKIEALANNKRFSKDFKQALSRILG